MRLEEIQRALEAASAVSNHRQFVIAGSLSVLGLMVEPPPRMSMSIDIDFYPKNDPGRASEIAAVLGEDTEFHEKNGYYLDAVSPYLPVLPEGWEDRLVEVPLGHVTAYFLDVHDTAVSKYARGALNDYRWIEAGYEAGLLKIETVEARVRFATNYFDDEDRRKTNNGLLMHRAALRSDGVLAAGLLDFLHANLPAGCIKEIDLDGGQYSGRVVWGDGLHAVQELADGDLAIHDIAAWGIKPEVNLVVTIAYENGRVDMSMMSQPKKDRGQSCG
jgi:hypothetical protein